MTKLLPLLFMSILLSAEMEVDGNLKVTGTVESTTIDSLKAVIAELQAQLAALNTHTTCLLRMVEFSGSPADDNVHLCTEGLSEPDCYNYYNFDSDLQINIEENLWSSTSSCSDFGHSDIFDLCIESNEILSDTSHCNLTWYCSGDCENLLEEYEGVVLEDMSGCTLVDASNYDPSASIPCTTNCLDGQTGGNCCCEIISICDGVTGFYLWGGYYAIETTTSINVWNQGLTGSIPPEIGCLTNITHLNLNVNQLSGSIPPEIGNLTNITNFQLNNNQLTGEIPPELGNLTNLTEFTLSSNQLSGDIPQEVCDLIESNNLNIVLILNGNNLINTCE